MRIRRHKRFIAAILFGAGLVIAGTATVASAASPTMSVSPNTGVTGGQSVSVTGSGFAHSSIGTILECNDAPSEPTVALGSPVNTAVSVGCTPPSYSHLVSTQADGSISTSWTVASGTIGPPCGSPPDIATCPTTDSAGQNPATDAANFPCPPTAAQQAAGVTCSLNYGDAAGDTASGSFLFQGETSSSTTTTTSASTTTTASSTTTTGATASTTTLPPVTSGSGGGTTGATSSGTPPTIAASSGALAQTGPGSSLWVIFFVGVVLMSVGGVMWVTPLVRRPRGAPTNSTR